MKKDNQSDFDLFTNHERALTDDELLAIHGGASYGGGSVDDSGGSDSHGSIGHGGAGDIGGGGDFSGMNAIGFPVPPEVARGVAEAERAARAAAEAAEAAARWAAEKAAERAIRILDSSGLWKTPIIIEHIVPPKPQA